MNTLVLLEDLTKDQIYNLFEKRFGVYLLDLIFNIVDGTESNFESLYGYKVSIKLPLILKLLSLLKSGPTNKVLDVSEKALPILAEISFILNNKNLKNNLSPTVIAWIEEFNTLRGYSNLLEWLDKKQNLLEIIMDKIYGEMPYEPVYSGPNYKIYEFTNPVMARKLGKNTRWCVSSPTSGKEHFKSYKDKNFDLFALIFEDSDQRYLLGVVPGAVVTAENLSFDTFFTEHYKAFEKADLNEILDEFLRYKKEKYVQMSNKIKELDPAVINKLLREESDFVITVVNLMKKKKYHDRLYQILQRQNPPSTEKLYDILTKWRMDIINDACLLLYDLDFDTVKKYMEVFKRYELNDQSDVDQEAYQYIESRYGIKLNKIFNYSKTFKFYDNSPPEKVKFELKTKDNDVLDIFLAKQVLSYYSSAPKIGDFAKQSVEVLERYEPGLRKIIDLYNLINTREYKQKEKELEDTISLLKKSEIYRSNNVILDISKNYLPVWNRLYSSEINHLFLQDIPDSWLVKDVYEFVLAMELLGENDSMIKAFHQALIQKYDNKMGET